MLRKKRDATATLVGMLVFLVGLAIILFAFLQAYQMFTTPPSVALGPTEGQPLDVNQTLGNATEIVLRIVLLLVMTIIGSVLANRGIKMYSSGAALERDSAPHEIAAPEDRSAEQDPKVS